MKTCGGSSHYCHNGQAIVDEKSHVLASSSISRGGLPVAAPAAGIHPLLPTQTTDGPHAEHQGGKRDYAWRKDLLTWVTKPATPDFSMSQCGPLTRGVIGTTVSRAELPGRH